MNDMAQSPAAAIEKPVVIPVEAYTSEAYARAESDKLWAKVWQVACREEEIPKVGDYVTYDILDDSIIIVRSAAGKISAYHNVCQHRGRRLTEGSGNTRHFRCGFHGWAWGIDGESSFVLDPQDWGNCLNKDNLRLPAVQVDTWGGWVWINMDPDCEPLKDDLEPAVSVLAPLAFDKMRYRWRQWLYFPCNWKVALEAFNESYHTDGTHPQIGRWGSISYWAKAENNCAWHGAAGLRRAGGKTAVGDTPKGVGVIMDTSRHDPRVAAATQHNDLVKTLDAMTTKTIVGVANRLVDELPEGTPPAEIQEYLMASAEREDAERGVVWPKVDPMEMAEMGYNWHIFPNTVFLAGLSSTLCYRARPNGYDPDSCIFEVYVLELFPEGEEPKTEWEFKPDPTEESWRLVLSQDFSNMPEIQKGTKSRGFKGPRPSPVQELAVTHLHRLLAKYMGTGEPQPLT